jgi:hypothetical protein
MTITQLIARLRELQLEAGSKEMQVFKAQLLLAYAEPVDRVQAHPNRKDVIVLW